MIELHFQAERAADLKLMLMDYLAGMKDVDMMTETGKKLEQVPSYEPPLAEVPVEETEKPKRGPVDEPVKPVLTQEQMAENIANAPEHTEPEQPSIEEVRAALKELRDKKGKEAVKAILNAYNAKNLTELKPEDYLGARDRALMEV